MPQLHARFIAPAKAYPQLWRLLAGVLLIVVVFIPSVSALMAAAWWVMARDQDGLVWMDRMISAETATGTLLLLATFLPMALATFLAARLLHKRGPGTLFGPRVRVFRDFVIAFGIVGGMLAISVGLWSLAYDAVPNLPPARWALLLPLALLGVLIQTGAEEVLFRGYLQQQLGARFRSPLVWMVVPSLLFGLVHFDAITMGENAWLVVGYAAIFGLFAADLTARTGCIGAAWGFHFANNVLAILILATDGTITGLSLYLTPYRVDEVDQLNALILLDLGFMVLVWFLVRRAVAR